MKTLSFLLLFLASSAYGAHFDCLFEFQDRFLDRLAYICYIGQGARSDVIGNDTTIDDITGTHTRPGFGLTEVNVFTMISDKVFTSLPENFDAWLPNLFFFDWIQGSLETLTADDLHQFPKLEYLNLQGNRLHTLEGHLFVNNPLLKTIDISNNALNKLGRGVLSGLYDIVAVNFEGNECVDYAFHRREEMPELVQRMEDNCGIAGECPLRCSLEVEVDYLRKIVDEQDGKIADLQRLIEATEDLI